MPMTWLRKRFRPRKMQGEVNITTFKLDRYKFVLPRERNAGSETKSAREGASGSRRNEVISYYADDIVNEAE